jgi:SWI/SNF-related matrix-associated actin-dependent regulator 1 of chromatin subfamily A
MTNEELIKLAVWSEPREIVTKYGPRILRKAAPTPEFSEAWKTAKADVKSLGAGFSKNQDGEWELAWWAEIPAEVVAARADRRDASRATDADVNIPAPAGLEYMPFQKAGIQYATRHNHTLIADQMGLGKTIQAIGVVNADPSIKRVLVICPASLKLNWERELTKWLVVPRTVQVVAGNTAELTGDVVIINFDILHKFVGAHPRVSLDPVAAAKFDLVVVDECHYAKSPGARRSKATYAAVGTAPKTLWLTGTPIVNRPKELLPLLEAIGPQVTNRTGNGFRFLKRYCNAHHNGYGWDFDGAANLAELQDMLRETCMVRRLKSDVLTELPAKRRQILELSKGDYAGILRRENAAVAAYENKLVELRAAVELSKASDDPADYERAVAALEETQTVEFAEMSKIRHDTAVAKIPAVVAHLTEILDTGEKVVVFAHHHDVVDGIMAAFPGAVKLVGGMGPKDKQNSVDRFQTDPNVRLFVGSITAAGVGITLTAATNVVFAELDWVPGNISQAEDRLHRIGQTGNVLVQHLVLEDSIDARLAHVLVEKQKVIDTMLDKTTAVAYPTKPVFPAAEKTATAPVEEIRAMVLNPEQTAAAHSAMRFLAERCDNARSTDGAGFSKIDAIIGKSLAATGSLSPRQAALAFKIARKYRKTQLPAELRLVLESIVDQNSPAVVL